MADGQGADRAAYEPDRDSENLRHDLAGAALLSAIDKRKGY